MLYLQSILKGKNSMQARSIEEIAIAAKQYARAHIREGYTQLEVNAYSAELKTTLYNAVNDLRSFRRETDCTSIHTDEMLDYFDRTVRAVKKYSLGNCSEFAFLALEYVVEHEPNVNAEIFQIENGDHEFLVLGRDPNSNPANPLTWGENAYICDPWSNRVFKASDYLKLDENGKTLLTNYRYKAQDGSYVNTTESFNPQLHKLALIKSLTDSLRNRNTREYIDGLKENYNFKLTILSNLLTTLNQTLTTLMNKIKEKHGEEDSKYKILLRKTKQIDQEINQINSMMLDNSEVEESKEEPNRCTLEHEKLRKKLSRVLSHIYDLMCFDGSDQAALVQKRGLFKSKTVTAVNTAFRHFQENLELLSYSS